MAHQGVDDGIFVNLLMLSMPSFTSLQDKTIVRAEEETKSKPLLRKYVKVLASTYKKDRFSTIGGPWVSELDGEHPNTDPRVLINTAVRIAKDQLNLDLSHCTSW